MTKAIFAVLAFSLSTVAYPQSSNPSRVYEIWDDQPAPNRGGDFGITKARGYPYDEDWELRSYPIGNGHMGANLFGRTDVERIQLTEETLYNEGLYGIGGMTSCAEIYLDINHADPENYRRSININEATSIVEYEIDGVKYRREHFLSYPDDILAIRLSSNRAGKVSFTLRPEIPYLSPQSEANAKTGTIAASHDLITLSGNVRHFSTNYEVQIKVINEGGSLAANAEGKPGTITVSNADSVVLLISADTNYKLSQAVFAEETNHKKNDISETPHLAVSKVIENAANKGFAKLKERHLEDYQNLFSRVQLVFTDEIPEATTASLLEQYKENASNHYLEELMFHYGRYLLISTSREGTLPCGLQGVWSQYEVTPFTGGFWHNINVQMNYWGAFNTNLAETFLPYVDYHEAYRPAASNLASEYLEKHNPKHLADNPVDNGWTIGTGATPYRIQGPGGHSGPGTGALTSKLFWEYYDFTRDEKFLREKAYPAILGMAKFLSKTLVPSEEGWLLVDHSASPEQKHNGDYYITKGTTFDQTLVWENHKDLIETAKLLGIDNEFIQLAKEQITRLDPIIIGDSGQIKEFREETLYGEIGQKNHRHISHLCSLYPGTLINSTTKDWLQGSIATLDLRGDISTGWAMAHRMNCRARTKEGEKAHQVYTQFIQSRTLPNLWTTHPPFQIDGNFGCMAGVAEMLLQSHEGYIDPLAALPRAWKDGYYKGLVARGNFEIAATWEDGIAKSIEIASKVGGLCKIKNPTHGYAMTLTDADGTPIPYTQTDSGLVEFSTSMGARYSMVFSKK